MSGEERIAVLTPAARDGPLTVSLLARAGVKGLLARDGPQLLRLIEEGVESVLVAEEALSSETSRELRTVLEHQEPWSDLPLIIFAASSDRTRARRTVESLAPLGNVVLLERPVSTRTLLSSVQAALRARRRQYAARQVVEQLAGAVHARDEFLAMLGHELRNPLAAMLVASDFLQDGARDPARSHAIIARQVRKLGRLVDDLLEVSRVSSGKIPLQREALDLREIVRRSVEVLEFSTRRADLSLAVSLPGRAVVVDGDALRLEQVVGNLLSNAVKYTPHGGSITVELEAPGETAVLRVRDSGVGIPAGDEDRIFEPFAQVPSAFHRSEGGLGLGLSLVRGLVGLHGGRVAARSEGPNKGSEFVVELPMLGELLPPPRAVQPPPPSTGRRVLVVDDQQDNREALVMALEDRGHVVREAPDGPSAVRVALEMVPDAVIVDIGLPGFDGYEVARRIRAALGRRPWLVALTGYGLADAIDRAHRSGFDQHFTKPVELRALLHSISAPRAEARPAAPP